MYFGSVKFFKHLIIGVIILAIVIPTGLCIWLGIENNKKEENIAQLSKEVGQLKLSGALDFSNPDDIFQVYSQLDREKKADFLKKLSEDNYELYASFVKAYPTLSEIPSETTTAATTASDNTVSATTTVPTETTPDFTTTPPPEASVYADLYPELVCNTTKNVLYEDDENHVYLTFDDGPSQYTESILYYLDKYNIKATFFVVPSGSEDSKRLLKKIADGGHTIGVHSATHVYKDIYANVEAYLSDFKIAYDRIYEATGIKCELFRFPGGSINDFNENTRDEIIAEMTRRGFVYFDWNVDSNDAGGADWTEMYVNVLGQTANANRAVILMHDHNNGYNTVLVLEDIIKALINDARGYTFGKLTNTVRPVQF